MTLSILTVPAFDDNYLWLVHNGSDAIVIDPGDDTVIVQALEQYHLQLRAILITHHHRDHTGGVAALQERYQVPSYGPAHDGIANLQHELHDQNQVQIAELNVNFRVIEVPGHTHGHIAYYAQHEQWLFCGDTLFGGGCGRLFEGTAQEMLSSLDKLAALPDSTQVFCAHEYTLANLKFAREVEADNHNLNSRILIEQEKRQRGMPTIPSTIGLEKLSNPFLRTRINDVRQYLIDSGRAVPDASDADFFAALRTWKNNFK